MTKDSRFVSAVPALVVMLMMLTPARAAAQTTGVAPSTDHQQIISANPFGLMFEWFNVEYARRLTPSTTWGLSASWFARDHEDFDYASGNATVRYYPSGSALRGFYLGGRGGAYHVSDGIDSGTFFGAGFEIGYDWLLGRNQNIGLSIGIGATRLFGGELSDASLTIPTLRLLNLGVAF